MAAYALGRQALHAIPPLLVPIRTTALDLLQVILGAAEEEGLDLLAEAGLSSVAPADLVVARVLVAAGKDRRLVMFDEALERAEEGAGRDEVKEAPVRTIIAGTLARM